MTARSSAAAIALASLLPFAGTAFGAQPMTPVVVPHAPAAEPPATPAAPAQADPAIPATPGPGPDGSTTLVQPEPPQAHKDAKVEHLVTEDSQVRIEETRVRGITTKIVVHSKIPGVADYEIKPRNPGVDPENDPGAGMRLFNFKFGS